MYLWASALALQLSLDPSAPKWRSLLFGAVLGLAYLIKAVMFPLAFAFIATLLVPKNRLRRLPAVLLTTAASLAVATPSIFALSKSKGRWTYGDAGAVNYRHIMGDDLDTWSTSPRFAQDWPRPIAAPHIAEFSNKASLGTYPPWADPSFDYDGAPLRFHLGRQLNRIHVVLVYYLELYVVQLGALLAGVLSLLLLGQIYPSYVQRFLRLFPLWLPGTAGLALYALVRVEGRMLAGITIVLFSAILAATGIEATEIAQNWVWKISAAVAVVLFAQIAFAVAHRAMPLATRNLFPDWQVVTELQRQGIGSGDRVSYMGDALTDHA